MKEKINIKFEARLEFDGSLEDFKALQNDLGNLGQKGLKIDTVPLPEDKAGGLMIDTVPLPESPAGGLMIGTWPTPEKKGLKLVVSSAPLPKRPILAGIPAITKILGKDLVSKLSVDMPRLKHIEGINGGIRVAHLHLKDEVVLLNPDRFRILASEIAIQLGKDLRDL